MPRGPIVAGRFLTRIPLPGPAVEAHELAPAAAYFPLVGALVGAVVAGLIAATTPVFGLDVAVFAGLVFGALLTGGFHEDGLADACDGLGGGVTRERALAIMRDSRIGSYGALALVLLCIGRFTLFRTLGGAQLLIAYPIASALGRASSVFLMGWLPNARAEGVADDVGRDLGRGTVAIAVTTPIFLATVLSGLAALPLALVATGTTIAAGLYLRRRLGGITGDCLGAVNVVVEVATLACAVALVQTSGPLEVLQWP